MGGTAGGGKKAANAKKLTSRLKRLKASANYKGASAPEKRKLTSAARANHAKRVARELAQTRKEANAKRAATRAAKKVAKKTVPKKGRKSAATRAKNVAKKTVRKGKRAVPKGGRKK